MGCAQILKIFLYTIYYAYMCVYECVCMHLVFSKTLKPWETSR